MKDLIAASRQALKVLEDFVDDPRCQKEIDQSSIALRTAIEAAEKQQALDKKAENAMMQQGLDALKELVAKNENSLFAPKHDSYAMANARGAVADMRRFIERQNVNTSGEKA